jgi:hypothetical protein
MKTRQSKYHYGSNFRDETSVRAGRQTDEQYRRYMSTFLHFVHYNPSFYYSQAVIVNVIKLKPSSHIYDPDIVWIPYQL